MTLFCVAGIAALVNNFGLKALNPDTPAKNGTNVVTPAAPENGSAAKTDPAAEKKEPAAEKKTDTDGNAVPVKPDKPTRIRRTRRKDSDPEAGSGSSEESTELSVEYPEAITEGPGSSTKEAGSSTKEAGSGSTTKEAGSATKEAGSGSATKEAGSSTKESGSATKESGSATKNSGASVRNPYLGTEESSSEETQMSPEEDPPFFPEENGNGSTNASQSRESQMHSIRFLFNRARNEMKRGRLDSASEQFKMIEAIVEGGKLQGGKISVAQELKNGRSMVKWLDGFYDHVKEAALMYKGGQLEPEPGIIVGFVEGNQRGVVMRFGENVAIPYRSMSPGLAMTLALKKGARNVPDWRLQQAAFRIFHSERTDKSEAKTKELIAASEADGYEVEELPVSYTHLTLPTICSV